MDKFVIRGGNPLLGTVRVSGAKLLPGPAWSDPGAKPGLRYQYSVTAVDASGNESARSAERAEALP